MSHESSMGDIRRSPERPREHKVTVRLSEAEMAAMTAAADRAGLTLAAYIIRAGIDAAEHRTDPITEMQQADREKPGSPAGFQRRTPLARKRPSALVGWCLPSAKAAWQRVRPGYERQGEQFGRNHHRSLPGETGFC